MLRHVVREGTRTRWNVRRVVFVHVSHDADQRAFFQETTDLKAKSPPGSVSVTSILSSIEGRLDKAKLQKILSPLDDDDDSDYEVYVCGPSSFVQASYDLVRSLGVDDQKIHAESFGPATLRRDNTSKEEAPPMASQAVTVRFTKSQVDALWTPTQKPPTLLELAEAEGLEPDYGCRLGSCGTCRTKITRGAVTYSDNRLCLKNDDIEDTCLLCQAFPKADVDVIDLDL
mmetsp:Transcript_33771/g.107910  ORF Transcript_33771/g.107910 Transcript_33771/m.107910 type:complete len:229 (-) Transcript_33771:1138-1824(-)